MARHASGQTVTDPQHEWEDIDNVLHVVGWWTVDTMNENEWSPQSPPVQSLAIFVNYKLNL